MNIWNFSGELESTHWWNYGAPAIVYTFLKFLYSGSKYWELCVENPPALTYRVTSNDFLITYVILFCQTRCSLISHLTVCENKNVVIIRQLNTTSYQCKIENRKLIKFLSLRVCHCSREEKAYRNLRSNIGVGFLQRQCEFFLINIF